MEYKKLNSALLLTVIALFVTTILVLIKVLFSGAKGFEWGSVSDWFSAFGGIISAIGTLGTLWIAYQALKKAPEWMAEKHYNVAFSIIEDAVFKDLSNVSLLSLQLKAKMVTLARNISSIISSRRNNPDVTESLIEAIKFHLEELHQASYKVINQLKSIDRTNYKITDYTNNIITLLQDSTHEYRKLYVQLYSIQDQIERLLFESDTNIDLFISNLSKIQMITIDTYELLSKNIDIIFSDNQPINAFITHKES